MKLKIKINLRIKMKTYYSVATTLYFNTVSRVLAAGVATYVYPRIKVNIIIIEYY